MSQIVEIEEPICNETSSELEEHRLVIGHHRFEDVARQRLDGDCLMGDVVKTVVWLSRLRSRVFRVDVRSDFARMNVESNVIVRRDPVAVLLVEMVEDRCAEALFRKLVVFAPRTFCILPLGQLANGAVEFRLDADRTDAGSH